MNVHLHIDHLVLDGLPVEAGQGELVQAAVQVELTRLLTDAVLAPGLHTGGARPLMPSEDIHLTGNDTPTTLGQQIGRVIHRGISR